MNTFKLIDLRLDYIMWTWTLILLVYAGPFAKGDSVALTNVTGFQSQQECMAAGNAAKTMTDGTYKESRFICAKVGK